MTCWSFFNPLTGEISGACFMGPDGLLAAHTPAGMVPIEGRFDGQSQRVQLVTDDHGMRRPVVVDYVPPQPADTEMQAWRWDADRCRWIAEPTLAARKIEAGKTIDALAGAARLRYVTDVPGQQGVYLRKAEQAAAFVASNGEGAVPPYITAEAQATGLAPLAAAERISAIAQQWDDVIGPAIERARIGGKAGVDAATDEAGVATALDAARTTLQTI